MHHEIKIDQPFYDAVLAKKKTFEIRYNDRGYNAGDTIDMRVYGTDQDHIHAEIGYVTAFNQKDNWVVFSLINVCRAAQ